MRGQQKKRHGRRADSQGLPGRGRGFFRAAVLRPPRGHAGALLDRPPRRRLGAPEHSLPDRLSGGHQRPRLHPDDSGEPLRALLRAQPHRQRAAGHPRPHLLAPVRGRLPPRLAGQRRPGQHLSSEARGRRPQAGRTPHHREPVHAVGQAHRRRGRRLCRHRRGARSVHARPRRHHLRAGEDPGRHAVLRHPRVPAAARRARGRGAQRPAPGGRSARRRRGRQGRRRGPAVQPARGVRRRAPGHRLHGGDPPAAARPRRRRAGSRARHPERRVRPRFPDGVAPGRAQDGGQAGRGGRRRLHLARLRARVAPPRGRGRHHPHAHHRGVHPGHQGGDPRGQARGHQDPRSAHAGGADHRRGWPAHRGPVRAEPARRLARGRPPAGDPDRRLGVRRSRATRSWSRSARRPSTTTSTSRSRWIVGAPSRSTSTA